jgi:hypothetical protein
MSDSENTRKHALECLRLASDLTQLASETRNPDLKAHCVRMSKVWTNQAEQSLIGSVRLRSVSYH